MFRIRVVEMLTRYINVSTGQMNFTRHLNAAYSLNSLNRNDDCMATIVLSQHSLLTMNQACLLLIIAELLANNCNWKYLYTVYQTFHYATYFAQTLTYMFCFMY